MRILILGNSDTTGLHLDRGERPWPDLLAEMRPHDTIDALRFVPTGNGVAYASRKVAELQPDIVVVPLSVYACAVRLVSESVGRRFGARARSAYLRLEHRYDGVTRRDGAPGRLNRLGQLAARRLLGAVALTPVDAVIATYSSLLRHLAQSEGTQVVVMGDGHFDAAIRRQNPAIPTIIGQVQAAIRPIAAVHRFTWTDAEVAFRATGQRRDMMHPDGIHLSAAGHRLVAALVNAALPPVEPPAGGSPPVGAGQLP